MSKLTLSIIIGLVGVGFVAASGQGPTSNVSGNISPAVVLPASKVTPVAAVAPTPIPTQTPTTELSNNTYYTNSSGNSVHSPANSSSVPVGTTARCVDGTYSFSQHHSGTCSHHGGVALWL